ncbi:small ribosomal subunit protein mS35 [Parasteatoda tepidariorum]|uniref:small ribosomal subunit protein mS35 n=1 Tax=Parasteatoda tepidariorum TaxID=114398 RepID=UPI00077FE322|nr:28S ribosomal protein S35, mitochondrial [Parasteatoda tepidariorum]
MAGVVNLSKSRINLLFIKYYSANFMKHREFSSETNIQTDEEFRVLELYPMKKAAKRTEKRFFRDAQVLPPREKRMPIDQDWPSVWPAAKTFRPSAVPLPVYQGYDQKRAPPGKYANAELMKIPNFLHLTPPAVKRHCAAIKKFCTEWPKGLETDEDCEKHFPVEIITSDYCHASPTIRDERSRAVTLTIKLSSLNFDYHARDKLLRLAGSNRYKKGTDELVITASRCPLRKQNYDYLMYLLTALHHESWVTEPWEHKKTEADMEKFFFENSRIENKMSKTIALIESKSDNDNIVEETKNSEKVTSFGKAVTELLNKGETEETLSEYKKSVLNSLGLSN